MKIRQGTSVDLAAFEGVLKEAATRIKATGSTQWGHILAGEETAIIIKHLADGEAFLYEEMVEGATKVVAAFYLYQKPNQWDLDLWGAEQGPNSYYLHRLSLADGYTGKGLAEQLLSDLDTQLSFPSQAVIRLDCIATQPVLNNLYQRSGFSLVKVAKERQAGPIVADFNLYQRQVTAPT